MFAGERTLAAFLTVFTRYLFYLCRAVAEWLAAPDTLYLLDLVRPDLLQLRTLSRALVLWDQVWPSRAWVDGHLPPLVRPDSDRPPQTGMDYQTIR